MKEKKNISQHFSNCLLKTNNIDKEDGSGPGLSEFTDAIDTHNNPTHSVNVTCSDGASQLQDETDAYLT